jgi:hypothetical protein
MRNRSTNRKRTRKIRRNVNLSDLASQSSNQPDLERINLVKDRLLNLWANTLVNNEAWEDVPAQIRRMQEEISMVIWMLEDWQIQMASRN